MAKRILVYPPKGTEPIEIFEEDLAAFEAKGWRTEPRTSKKPAKVETAKPSKGDN